MTEVLRVLFLEIKSSFALNKEVIDQMVHRAISFLLRIAYAITKFGAPRDDRVTTNEPQVGWDIPLFYLLTLLRTARDPETRAREKRPPNQHAARNQPQKTGNGFWRHLDEFPYV